MSRVLVVGGGAAGMMAALAAAGKGHRVTLFEKNEKLVGAMLPMPVNHRNCLTMWSAIPSFCTALSMVLIIMPCSSFLKPMAVP